jgi:Tol biopolymer transport system component
VTRSRPYGAARSDRLSRAAPSPLVLWAVALLASCTSAPHSVSASRPARPLVTPSSASCEPSPVRQVPTPKSSAMKRWRLAYAMSTTSNGQLDLYVAAGDGSHPHVVAASKENDEYSPTWSPDGQALAFRVNRRGEYAPDIWVAAANGSDRINLTASPNDTEWSPAWSPDGMTIAYYGGLHGQEGGDLFTMKPDGSDKRNLTRGRLWVSNEYPTWAPDGSRLAFIHYGSEGNFEIWVMDADGSCPLNLTNSIYGDEWPSWSPDGGLIAFMSDRDTGPDIFTMAPDGTNVRNLTHTPHLYESFPSWTPDGRIGFVVYRPGRKAEVWVMNRDGSSRARLPLVTGWELGPMEWTEVRGQ